MLLTTVLLLGTVLLLELALLRVADVFLMALPLTRALGRRSWSDGAFD